MTTVQSSYLIVSRTRGVDFNFTKMTLRAGASNVSVRAWRRYFTLSSVDAVIQLMREVFVNCGIAFSDEQIAMKCLISSTRNSSITADVGVEPSTKEPNLAFVSIVLGYIENHLTSGSSEEFDSLKLKKEHLDASCDNRELDSKSSSISRSLSSSSVVQETTQNSSHIYESPICRRHRTRRFGSRRVRQRNESSVSDSAESTGEFPYTAAAKDEPLKIITDMPVRKRRRFSDSTLPNSSFPCLTFDETERLYLNFYNLITTSPKLKPFIEPSSFNSSIGSKKQRLHSITIPSTETKKYASRSLICAICEVLWSQMTVSRVKERLTHTQSVYSFLTTGILDSFGLSYTVVAACQLLGYSDVDLALSEDHGWVEFGPPDFRQTADVASWVQESHTSTNSHNPDLFSTSHDDALQQTEHSRTRKISSSTEDECNPPSIRIPPLEHSWLYVNGYPVICRPRIMAVAAAIAAMQPGASLSAVTHGPTSEPFAYGILSPNPSVSSGGDLVTPTGVVRHLSSASVISMQLVMLKHRLLWLCFDAGCLSRYPLGLTNLGDLEDAFPTMGRLATFLNSSKSTSSTEITDVKWTSAAVNQLKNSENSPDYPDVSPVVMSSQLVSSDMLSPQLPETVSLALALYNRAVIVNQYYYANHHVYPYTCLAGCLYRHGDHRGALRHWAEATKVIGHYNHTSEDWEIYRELLEVATHLMPQMFRLASENSRSCSEGLVDADPDGCLYQPDNILDDPHCLSYLLSFYDHLCLWEEGSPVPVLHVGWVDKLMVNLTRFTQRARRHLYLSVASDKEDNKSDTVHSPALTHSTCKSSRWATESTDTLSETGISTKRTRRHRSSQMESTPTQSNVKEEQTKSADSVNPKLESMLDYPTNVNHESSVATKIQNEKDDIKQKPSGQSKKESKPRTWKSNKFANNITVEIPEEASKTNSIRASESYSPHTKSGLSSTHTNSMLDDVHSETDQVLDTEEQDGSPSPLVDFPNHDELLASLVEACDHRLLNPAFLWGVEPYSPFLPANIAPEEALNRLMTVLDESKPTILLHNSSADAFTNNVIHHIFPTPPNSGSLSESLDNVVKEESTAATSRSQKILLPTTPICSDSKGATQHPPTVVENESDSLSKTKIVTVEETLLPDGFDTVDGPHVSSSDFDLLANMPNELMDSVASLAVENQTVSPNPSSPADFFDLLLESENNLDKTICNHQDDKEEEEDMLNSDNQSMQLSSPSRHSTHRVAKTMEELSVHLSLYSVKMASIIELLRAPRLNSSAIKLALTAQSQVCVRRSSIHPTYF
ncbi:unnamed protein product [Heterobilharzia americana]|nr:unnamed protein product [Heterobilharzia americana]